MFSDKTTFMLNGKYNWKYLSDQNPHWMRENHTQWLQKVNVWAEMIDNNIISAVIIDGNLTGVFYCEILICAVLLQEICKDYVLTVCTFSRTGLPIITFQFDNCWMKWSLVNESVRGEINREAGKVIQYITTYRIHNFQHILVYFTSQ